MKILFIRSHIHRKNLNFILKCKIIDFHIVNSVNDIYNLNLCDYDAVYSPCDPIDVSKYPGIKFIFGPHFSVFPKKPHMNLINGTHVNNKNIIYIQPSEWAVDAWKNNILCEKLKILPFPFGVDTELFKNNIPITERKLVFIYYKSRTPQELQIVENFLRSKNIEFVIFSYKNRYDENYYLNYLKNSKFGVWLDAHESQGFALEEALSCNVPLFVWNIKSMNQEYGQNYEDIPATTIPYWDERCGEYFYNYDDLESKFELFISKLNDYKPREYILENLSCEKCENNLITLILENT